MRHAAKLSLTVLAVVLAGPLHAQTDATPEQDPSAETPPADAGPGLGLNLGEPVTEGPQIGDPYISAEFGDWSLRCVVSGTEDDPCQLYQLLTDQEDNAVAEISVFPLPDNPQAEAGVTLITPLETLLTENVTITIDAGQPKRYPFTFCTPVGCVSRIGLLPDEVAAFRRGVTAQVRIVPAAAPDQEVLLSISLRGFTADFRLSRVGWPAARRATEARRAAAQTFRSARTALSPPKAKAFDRATWIFASRATFGTTSSAHSGSGSS
jgi:invasion protein IalB